MPTDKKLESEHATQIKEVLVESARDLGIDLGATANKFTVWYEDGSQGYRCCGSAGHVEDAWKLIGRYQYMIEAIIFDAPENKITEVTWKNG